MSRSARPKLRLRAALLAGTALAVSSLAVATTADATPNVTDLEATVLRIGGSAVSGSRAIPSGRTLTPVQLTTADPEEFPGDGLRFGVRVPGFRVGGGARVPAQPAESVTFRIDGAVVATRVPEIRFTELRTDAGTLPAFVFAAGGATYALPLADIGTATRTVARSTVGSPVISFTPTRNGLLPVGAQTRVGTAFGQGTTNTVPTGPGSLVRYTLLDADGTVRNADSPSEELFLPGEPPASLDRDAFLVSTGRDVVATVSLRNGGTATVRSLRFDSIGSFGVGAGSFWFFDQAPLAAAGATIADVTGVISQAPSFNSLTWDELGFELVG